MQDQDDIAEDAGAPPGHVYRQKPRPVGFEIIYRLEGDRLVADAGRRVDTVALSAVREVRLTFESKTAVRNVYRTTLRMADGRSLSLTNVNWGLSGAQTQNGDYSAFVRSLVAAVAAANPGVVIRCGRSYAAWLLLTAIGLMTVIGVAGFAYQAISEGAGTAALIGLAVLALAYWQLAPLVLRNRPRLATAGDLPADLLPPK
ncbi:hypothetical protein IMF23_08335 [Chelatococcus daeguensis]|uniref:hypothetical protein n=1 Tax=Chelatococcus daeguensis TaxID=444444 RepID=UPI0012F9616F|nr:hypothetical protein [Chelatococcus daeguensis]MBM3083438.1 hypothetical protein [Chelatococcus daeguensis]